MAIYHDETFDPACNDTELGVIVAEEEKADKVLPVMLCAATRKSAVTPEFSQEKSRTVSDGRSKAFCRFVPRCNNDTLLTNILPAFEEELWTQKFLDSPLRAWGIV